MAPDEYGNIDPSQRAGQGHDTAGDEWAAADAARWEPAYPMEPAFDSVTQREAWKRGKPFAALVDGTYADLNANLAPATSYGYPHPAHWVDDPDDAAAIATQVEQRNRDRGMIPAIADAQPGEQSPDDDREAQYVQDWEDGGLPPKYGRRLDDVIEGRAPVSTLIPPRNNGDAIDWDNLPIVTRDQARKAREREQAGLLLELPYTGGWARVRVLDVMDRNALGWIPAHLQTKVANLLDLVENPTKPGATKVVSATEAWTRFQNQLKDSEDVANAFCIHGFIQPRIVATEAEADLAANAGENVMAVHELHINERLAYLNRSITVDEREARLLDPFRREQVATPSGQPRNKKAATA